MFPWLFKKEPQEPPRPPSEPRWIGNVTGSFFKENPHFEWKFWYQLYEDQYGDRTYKVTGRWPPGDVPESHVRYSVVIVPFLEKCDLNIVWPSIDTYEPWYWNQKGFYVRKQPAEVIPEAKPDFKLLKFPEPKSDENIPGDT